MKHVKSWLPVYLAAFGVWPLVPWSGHGTGLMLVVDQAAHLIGTVLCAIGIVTFLRENTINVKLTITRTIKESDHHGD
jgi:hypothetical protein